MRRPVLARSACTWTACVITTSRSSQRGSTSAGCWTSTQRRCGIGEAEARASRRAGADDSDADGAELRRLRQEVAELRRANEILKTASAFFAQAELDRRLR